MASNGGSNRGKSWDRAACGCVKATLPRFGKAVIRCASHRGASPKDADYQLCYFDDDGIVRSNLMGFASGL